MGLRLSRLAVVGLAATVVTLSQAALFAHAEDSAADKSVKFRWEFEGTDRGKWNPDSGLKNFKAVDGALVGEVTKDDPFSMNYSVNGLKVDTYRVPVIRVRMKHSLFTQFKFYFATADQPNLDEPKSVTTTVTPDGEWHDYEIEMDSNDLWDGMLKVLRFDLEPNGPGIFGATFAIDYIRLCDR